MTREEAQQRGADGIAEWAVDDFIDDIYDGFETRTCSTCKHMEQGVGTRDEMAYCISEETLMDSWQDYTEMLDYGCNKWESK